MWTVHDGGREIDKAYPQVNACKESVCILQIHGGKIR